MSQQATTTAANPHLESSRDLPPTPDPPLQFGEWGDYWKRYYDIAKVSDEATKKRLGGDLDILLIFAALFSGIDTAFIAITLPMLSPDPNDATNAILRQIALKASNTTLSSADLAPSDFTASFDAVRINAFFITSISCSLLAAFGAVLGKQWLAHAEQSQVEGSLKVQARHRQKMFTGTERWHLESTVELLPIVLQLALLSFWFGLIDLLFSLNNRVAYVGLAFACLGGAAYLYTVAAAVSDRFCPFQTPVTKRFLPHVGSAFVILRLVCLFPLYCVIGMSSYFLFIGLTVVLAILLLLASPILYAFRNHLTDHGPPTATDALQLGRRILRRVARIITWYTRPFYATVRQIGESIAGEKDTDASLQLVDGQTARWLLMSTLDEEAILQVSCNILALRDIRAVQTLAYPSRAFTRLVIQLQERLSRLQRVHTDEALVQADLSAAIILSRTLTLIQLSARMPLGFSTGMWGATWATSFVDTLKNVKPRGPASPVDELCIFQLLWMQPDDMNPYLDLIPHLQPGILTHYIAAVTSPYYIAPWEIQLLIGHDAYTDERRQEVWYVNRMLVAEHLAIAAIRSTRTDPKVVNTVAWCLYTLTDSDMVATFLEDSWRRGRWQACFSDENLVSNISDAINGFSEHVEDCEEFATEKYTIPPFVELYSEFLSAIREVFGEAQSILTYGADITTNWRALREGLSALLSVAVERATKQPSAQHSILCFEAVRTYNALLQDRLTLQSVSAPSHLDLSDRPSPQPLWVFSAWTTAGDPPAEVLAALLALVAETPNVQSEQLPAFQQLPSAAKAFSTALGHVDGNVSRQALRAMATHSDSWFQHGDADIHDQFAQGDLASNMATFVENQNPSMDLGRYVLVVIGAILNSPHGSRYALIETFCDRIASASSEKAGDRMTEVLLETWQMREESSYGRRASTLSFNGDWDLMLMIPVVTTYVRRLRAATDGQPSIMRLEAPALRNFVSKAHQRLPEGSEALLDAMQTSYPGTPFGASEDWASVGSVVGDSAMH